MHRFSGNNFLGCWWVKQLDGSVTSLSPEQVREHSDVVWVRTDDSGDFLWPHMQREDGTIEQLVYEE